LTAPNSDGCLAIGRWIKPLARPIAHIANRNDRKDIRGTGKLADFMAENADLIWIELRAFLIGGDIPDVRLGMRAHHGGKVIDQLTLIETQVCGGMRHSLNCADPTGERRKKPIRVPRVPLHDERRDGVAVPSVRLSV
jgi:hypothetical protein